MFLPILQKQKPLLNSVLILPRNHKASKWHTGDQSPKPGALSAPPFGLRHRQVCFGSQFDDALSFELNSVFQALKLRRNLCRNLWGAFETFLFV